MGISSYSSCSIEKCYAKSISLHASRHASLPPTHHPVYLRPLMGLLKIQHLKQQRPHLVLFLFFSSLSIARLHSKKKLKEAQCSQGTQHFDFYEKYKSFQSPRSKRLVPGTTGCFKSTALNSIVYVTLLTPTCVVNMVKLFNWQILCKSIIKENQKPVLIFSTSILCHNPSIQHI